MAISCDGNGNITLETIVNAVNDNESSIDNLHLNDLFDVDAPSPSNGEVIVFDATQNKWVTAPPPNAQIQSDWNQTDNSQPDFIKNKPNLDDYEENLGTPANDGDVLTSDTSGNRQWVTANSIFGIDLDYEEAPNYGRILNDSGTDATIPVATHVIAGLLSADDKTSLDLLLTRIDGGTY